MLNSKYAPLAIIAVIVLTIGSSILGAELRDSGWKKAAIEHGCAQYNATTGHFEWKDTL